MTRAGQSDTANPKHEARSRAMPVTRSYHKGELDMKTLLLWTVSGMAAATLLLSSCSRTSIHYRQSSGDPSTTVVTKTKKGGPPPHAPAHGYRHKHESTNLVYRQEIGVYVVEGYPDHYFSDGHYYRERGTRWEISVHLEGPWKVTSTSKLPMGLKSYMKSKGK